MRTLRAFLQRAEIQTLLTQSGWLFGDRLARAVVNFATAVLLARYLAPQHYGIYVYGVAFAGLFLPFSTLGLERIAVRELSRGPEKRDGLLGTLWVLRGLGGALGAGVATMAAWFAAADGPGETRLLIMLLAGANVLLAFDVVDWLYQSRGNFRSTTLVRCAAFLIGATLRIGLAWSHAPLTWIAGATLAELALGGLLQVLVFRVGGQKISRLHFQWNVAKDLLRASAPLLLAEAVVLAFLRLDLIILGGSAPAAETGYYGVAVRIAQAAYFIPPIIVQVFSPQIARCATDSEALAASQKVMNLLFAWAVAVGIFISAGAPWIVQGLLGSGYAPVISLVRVMAWGNVFAFMGSAHSLFLVNRGRQKAALGLNVLSSVTSVALFAFAIPRWGAIGAAVAGVGAGLLTTTPGLWLMPSTRELVKVDLRAVGWLLSLPWRLLRERV